MRFGICLPNNQGVEHVRDLARLAGRAEEMGYESVWVSDHLFHTSYVAARLGRRPYHDPLVVLAAAATATARVKLGTSVLVLPWHHPVRLAKALSSLDDLSGGRIILGAGVAEAEDEYRNLGLDFAARGRYTDEILEAFGALWGSDPPSFAGEFISFGGLSFAPKPVQRPGIPIWVGGSSRAALRRVVRFGQGWHPLSLSADQIRTGLLDLAAMAERKGRNLAGLRVAPRLVLEFKAEPWDRPPSARRTCRGTPAELREIVRAQAAAGVTDLVLDAATGDLSRAEESYRRFAVEVLAPLGEGGG